MYMPGYPREVYHLVYMPRYTPPGTPAGYTPLLASWTSTLLVHPVRREGALGSEERKPMGERPLSVLKSSVLLRLEGGFCAELPRSPHEEWMKDWITTG